MNVNRAVSKAALKDIPGARRDLDQAFTLYPEGGDWDRCVDRAFVLCKIDDRAGALSAAEIAVRQSPDRYVSYLIRARVKQHFGQRSDAIEDLNTALALEPTSSDALMHRARLLSEIGQADKAKIDEARLSELAECRCAQLEIAEF